jgi:YcaO-like protein with predicted kinase domain
MTDRVALFGREWTMPKGHFSGTHRVCSPLETLERLQPIRAKVGITRLANVTGLDTIGLPVWIAIRPNSRGLSTSQGKGLSHDAAKVSALMEGIEGWHGENIDLPLRFGSPEALLAKGAIADLAGLSYYAGAAPRPDMPLNWIEGWDLVTGSSCHVPFEAVGTDYVTGPNGTLQSGFVQSSNGLSGGNHIVEAVTHALFEVIERDAVARSAQLLRTYDSDRMVDLDTVTDPDCCKVLDLIRAAGTQVAVLDLTCDTGIPVFAATIVDADASLRWRTLPVFSGYGCHSLPGIALLRAINEAVQSRLTYITGSRDDISFNEYRRGGNAEELDALRVRLANTPCQRDFADIAALSTHSFGQDIAAILERLRLVGIHQVIAVDLTHPEIGIPVTKVVVPWLAAPVPMIRGRKIVVPDRNQLDRPETGAVRGIAA